MIADGPAPPKIQDIVVVTAYKLRIHNESYNAAGEYGISTDPQPAEGDRYRIPIENPSSSKRFFRKEEDFKEEAESERIVGTVKQLFEYAQDLHLKLSKSERKNTITRLLTNEFFFFTKEPLSIDRFDELIGEINKLVLDKKNKNICLILGSFAVITAIPEDGLGSPKLMNVTPHIQCGENPIINLIVKHKKSHFDPIYQKPGSNADYFYVNSEKDLELIQRENLNSIGIIEFSFENVIECTMKNKENNVTWYSCTDICIDHGHTLWLPLNKTDIDMSKAKKSLNEKLEGLEDKSVYCSHVLISNVFGPIPKNIIGGILTHADPIASIVKGRVNEDPESNTDKPLADNLCDRHEKIVSASFGPPKLKITATPPVPCNQYTLNAPTVTNSSTEKYTFPYSMSSEEEKKSDKEENQTSPRSMTFQYQTIRRQERNTTQGASPIIDAPTDRSNTTATSGNNSPTSSTTDHKQKKYGQ